MKTLKFKCKLLSDVILNQKAATEGPNQTLDFIPGSCFLGIVASKLYPENGDNDDKKRTMELFHSGTVRFGDAHPSKGGTRSVKIPASMFYPKLKPDGYQYYIHHLIPKDKLECDEFRKMQLKQCRNGFYIFHDGTATELKTATNFAVKSEYDSVKRRSKDEHMFGYESLQKGLELMFEVVVDNDNLAEDIKNALTIGKKRVGRSRTAQYGLVKIEYVEKEAYDLSTNESVNIDGKKCITVYADGRLIFLDEYGIPTFRPEAKDLGLAGGDILWEKSQIRTFQYAPWNFKRQCFDADRCGIEKGSVFVVDVSKCDPVELKSQYIGSYNNEGFGKVLYNPDFLKAEESGVALYQVEKHEECRKNVTGDGNERDKKLKEIGVLNEGNVLLKYLASQKKKEMIEADVYTMVNDWVNKNHEKFKGEMFASQWGTIRSIAMKNRTKDSLNNELFGKTTEKNGKTIPNAYLTHGVAADKWKERGRLKEFKSFFEKLDDDNAQIALINLAAEMAKKCRKEGK